MREFELFFYYNTKFKYENNFSVEDIATFLENELDGYHFYIARFQFQRPLLKTTIKIAMSQLETLAPEEADVYDDKQFKYMNYMGMRLRDVSGGTNNSKVYYYFILEKRWRGENTIELDLQMDVLNTFEWDVDVIADKKTLVEREHKDRFVSASLRKVDLYSEGLTPILYKKSRSALLEAGDSGRWNLVYRSAPEDASTGVACMLMPDADQTINLPNQSTNIIWTARKVASDILNYNTYRSIVVMPSIISSDTDVMSHIPNNWAYHSIPNVSQLNCKINSGTITLSASGRKESDQHGTDYIYDVDIIRIEFINDVLMKVTKESWEVVDHMGNISGSVESTEEWTATQIEFVGQTGTPVMLYNTATTIDVTPTSNSGLWTSAYQSYISTLTYFLAGINNLNKSDSRLYKIINIPYRPINFIENGHNFYESGNWTIDAETGALKLENLNIQFVANYITNLSNPLKNAMTSSYVVSVARNDANESKLLHSDFHQYKFIYDSFTFTFRLERINPSSVASWNAYFKFDFKPTSTINSKLVFVFPEYIPLYSTEDFDNVLPVARNNERCIYNNEYLNYLRTSYNYDLKSKERTIQTAKIGLGLGIGGSVLSGAMSVASGNPAVMISGVTGAMTSVASNIVSTINSIHKAEEDFAQKQDLLKAQSFSVSGSDDLDLFQYYSGNVCYFAEYEVSPRMKQAIADLFYYCGYATNEQKKPNISTRKYFNFVQGQLVVMKPCFNEEVTNEYIKKFSEGITFFHHITGQGVQYNYDIEQILENTEVSLL